MPLDPLGKLAGNNPGCPAKATVLLEGVLLGFTFVSGRSYTC